MTRIRRAFEARFRQLLARLNARQLDKGIKILFEQESSLRHSENLSPSQAFARINAKLARRTRQFLKRQSGETHTRRIAPLLCDAGLGGFARWLRALGYHTIWIQDITDDDLLREAQKMGAIIITTDSGVMERRLIRQGIIEAYWVPPSLTRFEQLELIRAELDLPPLDSRCMRCGGELIEVDREAMKDQIPPLTYKWVKEYFQCEQCKKLYWHGTHWQRITRKLKEVEEARA